MSSTRSEVALTGDRGVRSATKRSGIAIDDLSKVHAIVVTDRSPSSPNVTRIILRASETDAIQEGLTDFEGDVIKGPSGGSGSSKGLTRASTPNGKPAHEPFRPPTYDPHQGSLTWLQGFITPVRGRGGPYVHFQFVDDAVFDAIAAQAEPTSDTWWTATSASVERALDPFFSRRSERAVEGPDPVEKLDDTSTLEIDFD